MKLSDIYSPERRNRQLISLTQLAQKEYFHIISAEIVRTRFGDRYAFTVKLPGESQYYLLIADKGSDRDTIANYYASTPTQNAQVIGPLKLVRNGRYFEMQDYNK